MRHTQDASLKTRQWCLNDRLCHHLCIFLRDKIHKSRVWIHRCLSSIFEDINFSPAHNFFGLHKSDTAGVVFIRFHYYGMRTILLFLHIWLSFNLDFPLKLCIPNKIFIATFSFRNIIISLINAYSNDPLFASSWEPHAVNIEVNYAPKVSSVHGWKLSVYTCITWELFVYNRRRIRLIDYINSTFI